MRESKCYISVACFHYGGSDLLRFGKFEVLITSQALLSQKQPIFMQNYNFVKNNVFVAKICKYALYESSEGLFCAPRKAANFCHPVYRHSVGRWWRKGSVCWPQDGGQLHLATMWFQRASLTLEICKDSERHRLQVKPVEEVQCLGPWNTIWRF